MISRFTIIIYILSTLVRTVLQSATSNFSGEDFAYLEEFPWQVLIQYDSTLLQWCGGAILNKRYVLTAAQCVHERLVDKEKLRLVSGITDLSSTEGAISHIKSITYFEYVFDEISMLPAKNDIALLEIEYPLSFSNRISAINLPSPEIGEGTGRISVLSGWGQHDPDIQHPNKLRKSELMIIANARCQNFWRLNYAITDNMVCTDTVDATKNSYIEDPGGPIVIQNDNTSVLFALISIGSPRNEFPAINTRIAPFVKNITAKMQENMLIYKDEF